MYMNGPSFSMTGSSIVDGGIPANFSYFGTTNNTSFSMSGNATFVGTVYAPQANATLSGSGSNPQDFAGGIIVNTLSLNGHFNFHFDEALLNSGPLRGYAADAWKEM